LALDIREQIATGVALREYSQEQKERWHIELVGNSMSLSSDLLPSNTYPSALAGAGSGGQGLRIQNLEPLGAGGQLIFVYDVTVLKSQGREPRTP
jgi:hypothetical protein